VEELVTNELFIPKGYRFAGLSCGIKRAAEKLDLSLVVSDRDAAAAGVYTTNLVCAAPVRWDRRLTPASRIRAVAVNSGNANACTGPRGDEDAARMAALAGESIGVGPDQVLLLSTGIIGEFLPMEKIARGLSEVSQRLDPGKDAAVDAARGMMTTDTVPKLASRRVAAGLGEFRVLGMAKGAAMIGPRMATMLGIVLTDAPIPAAVAQQILSESVRGSFNCISVDGHMSTNDTVLLLANGAAAVGEPDLWAAAVKEVCVELAKAIPADGEGATHLVTIDVEGCATWEDADRIARSIANSPLVKTAIAGADPNWGRIVSAAGYAGVPFQPDRVGLEINGLTVFRDGMPARFDAAEVSASIKNHRDTHLRITFAEGSAQARHWTTDMTAEYVRLNADYHT
jgi:glutamate N-acetyltransferase/amino-acid N-acetyltransferase